MSLYIDTDEVTGVLLSDGWHKVSGTSFDIDAYEFHTAGYVVLAGGNCDLVPSTGFSFVEAGASAAARPRISGPLTAVLAVKTKGSN